MPPAVCCHLQEGNASAREKRPLPPSAPSPVNGGREDIAALIEELRRVRALLSFPCVAGEGARRAEGGASCEGVPMTARGAGAVNAVREIPSARVAGGRRKNIARTVPGAPSNRHPASSSLAARHAIQGMAQARLVRPASGVRRRKRCVQNQFANALAPALRADGVARIAHRALAKQPGPPRPATGVRRREMRFNASRVNSRLTPSSRPDSSGLRGLRGSGRRRPPSARRRWRRRNPSRRRGNGRQG